MRSNKVLAGVLVLAVSVAVESVFLFGAVGSLRNGVDALVSEVSGKVNLPDLAESLKSGEGVQQVLRNMNASPEPEGTSEPSEPFLSEESTESSPDAANIVSDGKSQLDLQRYDAAFASFSRAADLGDAEGAFYRAIANTMGTERLLATMPPIGTLTSLHSSEARMGLFGKASASIRVRA